MPTTSPVMHDYPGLGDPLRITPDFYPIGAHGSNSNSHSEPIFVRELAMMDIMEKLTDKPDWHKKVFDEEIVSKWKEEALAIPDDVLLNLSTVGKSQFWDENEGGQLQLRDDDLFRKGAESILNPVVVDYCINELQAKAKYFEETGIIPTLDACASVAKSDTIIGAELQTSLRAAFDKLKSDHQASPDWHPNSNDMVQDLVHPSMYPFVYGRTRLFQEECVEIRDSITHWSGKGTVVPKEIWEHNEARDRYSYGVGGSIPPNYWSDTYQWLPANLAFTSDGGVKFTSYINNLHPQKYSGVYRTIELLIEKSMPLWDQCLKEGDEEGAGRTDNRILLPDDPDDGCPYNWLPTNPADCADMEASEEDLEDEGYDPECPEDLTEYKWKVLRKAKFPDLTAEHVTYAPKKDRRLVERFRDSGLQVIVKMASIELTPEKPEFPVGGWHIEGQLNEHICGTAIYYLDSENITDSSLSFRMQTDAYINDMDGAYSVGQDSYHWMESVFGTNLGQGNSPCLQNYGSVQTRPGRLLAFPNVFQHRVSPFKLIDPTKTGHRRFIALWLVDPNIRIINTANVPPQQMNWYAEELLGTTPEGRKDALAKLPAELVLLLKENGLAAESMSDGTGLAGSGKLPEELMEMVREYFEAESHGMPMGIEEAKHHRAELMKERGAFVKRSEQNWQAHSYSFCEH